MWAAESVVPSYRGTECRASRTHVFGYTLLIGSMLLSACDFEVTNPGPVQDAFLDNPAAAEGIVNGAGLALSNSLNFIAFHGAAVTRETFPTGGTGQYGLSVHTGNGFLRPDEQGTPWSSGHQARWIAEDGLRRFAEVMDQTTYGASPHVARAALWAAFANRLLGENMCHAVIDRGPLEPREVFLQRAEAHFGHALEVAGSAGLEDVVLAAHAGRASVRMHLGDWAGAVSDAGLIPVSFVFEMPYFDRGIREEHNRIHEATRDQPYKTHTTWGTKYEMYYLETGDPRVPWRQTDQPGDGAVEGIGPVPWYPQQKFDARDSPIRLASGTEMLLIQAEAHLHGGAWQEGLEFINQVRLEAGVEPVVADGPDMAWTYLKRERGIELWLEGRRLGDFYRWAAENTPGDLDELEVPSEASFLLDQDLCFPIPDAERERNPNLN